MTTRRRSRRSARAAGTRFEREITRALAEALDDDRIERRARTGARDRGDITGVRLGDKRLVFECKDCSRLDLAGWVREARIEAQNDSAAAAFVIHKRRGVGDPLSQYVTCELRDLVVLLAGRPVAEADQ
jgi:Holliday junction resolvase